jgi:ABC-type antimicrobial peptide transport system permease subunit
MTFLRLAMASLRHQRRLNLALLLAVATTTAVLTGALLVGDSVRGSLRALVLDRLGRIDQVVITDVFFRDALVDQLHQDADLEKQGLTAEAAILVRGSLKNQRDERVTGRVTVIGCHDSFWNLGTGGPATGLVADQIVLTDQLAAPTYLDARVGDKLILQIGRPEAVPVDSPLGRKTDSVRRRQFTVAEIISADRLGGFSLSPGQQMPLNAFVSLDAIAEMLGEEGKRNLILVAHQENDPSAMEVTLEFTPRLEDYGLRLQPVLRKNSGQFGYLDLTSERLLLPEVVLRAAVDTLSDQPAVQSSLTYLANWITAGEKKIPYSTVTAIDSVAELGPLLLSGGEPLLLDDDQIVLNDWAAEELDVQPGDQIALTFFDPETTHGRVRERTEVFQLRAIVPLQDKQGRPTLANDPHLTPELEGVTDQQSIDDWDPPFPFDASRLRPRDEQYWDEHRATPKAFISRARGKQIWGSRFGDTTSLRIALPGLQADPTKRSVAEKSVKIRRRLEAKLADSGLIRFRLLRTDSLRAAGGTTPFGLLFLCFSLFLMAASLMLLLLLFRLGIDERSGEIGLLLALGFSRRRVFALLLLQTSLLAFSGGALGLLGGIAYAELMLLGLRTWWMQAVTTPFVHLHLTVSSLGAGYLASVAVCGIAIVWSLWQQRRWPLNWWLSSGSWVLAVHQAVRWRFWFAGTAALFALLLILLAVYGPPYLQAGLFFAAGGLALLCGLLLLAAVLRSTGGRGIAVGRWGILRMAARNLARHPQRSGLTIGLVATATFLVIAVGAFRLEDRGTESFDLIAESSLPLYFDLGTDEGRFELGISDAQSERLLEEAIFVSLRVHGGDDASCLNLYRARQPRVLGVPAAMPKEFQVAGLGELSWNALETDLGRDLDGNNVVPVILDENTARYGLGLFGGVGQRFDIDDSGGRRVSLQVVGLLKNSIFQGDLLLAESQLLRLFPETGGYQYFLIRVPRGENQKIASLLERKLSDFGMDVEPVAERLSALFAVQNTYLASFQSLGGLGLLFGTLGLVAVQLRNIFSRRSELALLRACGFRRSRLSLMVVLENLVLLLTGLLLGVVAAVLALLPHLILDGATLPWMSVLKMLLVVVIVGLIVGLYAVRAMLRPAPIIALRGE